MALNHGLIFSKMPKSMNADNQYAFYGSLRKGLENFALYQQDLRYLRTVKINGFKMYSLGDYPYIVRSSNDADVIIADLFQIVKVETEQNIHNMELEAGYIFSEVDIGAIKFGIYLFDQPALGTLMESPADWRVFRNLLDF